MKPSGSDRREKKSWLGMLGFRHRVMWQDLAVCLGLHVLLILLISFWPLPGLRALLGLVCLLFTPGYATLALFFPGGEDIDRLARFGLSPIVSVVVLIPAGLILNYSSWGLQWEVILAAVTVYVAVFGAAALWRRSRRDPALQYSLPWPGDPPGRRKMLFLFSLITVAAVAAWIFMDNLAGQGARTNLTEFYILGSDGKAGGYPRRGAVGETVAPICGIINREPATVLFHIVMMEQDGRLQRIASVAVESNQMWEQPCPFTVTQAGADRRITLLLYREGEGEPYRSLHFWMDVIESATPANPTDGKSSA